MSKTYITVDGLNYTPDGTDDEVRVEPDTEVDDLPSESIDWLLDGGHIIDPGEVDKDAVVPEADDWPQSNRGGWWKTSDGESFRDQADAEMHQAIIDGGLDVDEDAEGDG